MLSSTTAAALALCCSSCGSAGQSAPAPQTLVVLSSISNGAVVSNAVAWTGVPVGVATSHVARVQFLIDAKVAWTAQHPPYIFNGPGNDLFPWVLGAGAHRLAVRVLTQTGASASTAAAVTVSAGPPVPSALMGSFTRLVSTAGRRHAHGSHHGPRSPGLSAGVWRIEIARDGVISYQDPRGASGNEAIMVLPGGILTLDGPANWLLSPQLKGGFCTPEPTGAYAWSIHAKRLVLAPERDRCASRSSIFAGVWTRS
jgi:hypothetical protein